MPTTKLMPVVSKTVTLPKKIKVVLPTELSEIENDISKFNFFFYGNQKIGKTSLTTQFERSFHLLLEPGAKRYKIYSATVTSWKEYMAYVDALMEDESGLYKTVVVDVLDLLWDYCAKDVMLKYGVDVLRDIGFSDGYSMTSTNLRDSLVRLSTKYGIICISHAKEKMLKKVSAKQLTEIDYTHPSCSNTCSNMIEKWVDLTGCYYIGSDGRRYMRIVPSGDISAGNRISGKFLYKNGQPIQDIPMGNNEKEAFANFLKAFNNELDTVSSGKKLIFTKTKQ